MSGERSGRSPGTRHSRLTRWGARRGLLCLGVVVSLIGSGPAQAHTGLLSSLPAAEARLDHAPRQVQLRFGTPTLPDDRDVVHVFGPSGAELATGPLYLSGLGVSTRILPSRDVGRFIVLYSVTEFDSHQSQGGFQFYVARVRKDEGRGGPSPGVVAAGLLTVVCLAALVVRWRHRRRTSPRAQVIDPAR